MTRCSPALRVEGWTRVRIQSARGARACPVNEDCLPGQLTLTGGRRGGGVREVMGRGVVGQGGGGEGEGEGQGGGGVSTGYEPS